MIREIPSPDTAVAYRAMRELRGHLGDEQAFVRLVEEVLRPEGYRLLGAFESGESDAAAVAGFRTGHNTAWGHFLYVDDLSTVAQARRRGHGRALLEWLSEEGARLGCEQLHLDSGVGPERVDAHRLYFNSGLRISSHHFARGLARR